MEFKTEFSLDSSQYSFLFELVFLAVIQRWRREEAKWVRLTAESLRKNIEKCSNRKTIEHSKFHPMEFIHYLMYNERESFLNKKIFW
jgi:hypothetical protein